MNRSITVTVVSICLLCLPKIVAAQTPRWTVSQFGDLPLTFDSGAVLEGTSTALPWAWHAKMRGRWAYDIGLADNAHQTTADLSLGVGLPLNLELTTAFPVGWTVGSRQKTDPGINSKQLQGMGNDGFGIGDLRLAIMWSHAGASKGGLGFLVGFCGTVPTGDHEKLMGEGGFTATPFISLSLQVLSIKLTANMAYKIRPEHVSPYKDRYFEQDDDLIWRAGFRIPRKNDVAWSMEAEGAIGIATNRKIQPHTLSRPVWLGGGIDFPVSRTNRFGLAAGVGLRGEAVPDFTFEIRFTLGPVLPDEDMDGVGGVMDKCPLLPEDMDGFEDYDGCPDYDNDKDGFPDDEDQCPLDSAGNFSDNGC